MIANVMIYIPNDKFIKKNNNKVNDNRNDKKGCLRLTSLIGFFLGDALIIGKDKDNEKTKGKEE